MDHFVPAALPAVLPMAPAAPVPIAAAPVPIVQALGLLPDPRCHRLLGKAQALWKREKKAQRVAWARSFKGPLRSNAALLIQRTARGKKGRMIAVQKSANRAADRAFLAFYARDHAANQAAYDAQVQEAAREARYLAERLRVIALIPDCEVCSESRGVHLNLCPADPANKPVGLLCWPAHGGAGYFCRDRQRCYANTCIDFKASL